MSATHGARPGYHTVTPRIVVEDVAAQVEFLRVVFGATGDCRRATPVGDPNRRFAAGTAIAAERRRRRWRDYDTREIRTRLHERFAALDPPSVEQRG